MKALLYLTFFIYTAQANSIMIKLNNIELNVSENCINQKCEAIKKLKTIDLKQMKMMDIDRRGGKTLGEEVCRKVFQAEIIKHRDKELNEENYCHFKDLSSISTGQLSKYIYDQIYPERHSEK